MIKLKFRGLKWKMKKYRGRVLHFYPLNLSVFLDDCPAKFTAQKPQVFCAWKYIN